MNFPIDGVESRMLPYEVLYAMCLIKKVCAEYYAESQERNAKWRGVRAAIGQAANEIMAGENDDQFLLVIYQTGSGTQTNMNVNVVLSNRAIMILGGSVESKTPVHPNDHCNMGPSSNDSFPNHMHVACVVTILKNRTMPGLKVLHQALTTMGNEFHFIIKIGRAHCQMLYTVNTWTRV